MVLFHFWCILPQGIHVQYVHYALCACFIWLRWRCGIILKSYCDHYQLVGLHHLTSILQSFLERWHPLNQHVKTSFPRSSLWPSRTWKSLRTAAAGTTRIPVEKSRRRPLFDFLWDVFRLDHWMECCKNSVCSSWLVLDGTMSVYHAHNA